MDRRMLLLTGAGLVLSACTSSAPTLGADGRPLPKVYKIKPGDEEAIAFRLLDSVNTLRGAKALPPLGFDARLNAAAATHSRDMAVQNRPWHFGSDGSSPLTRAQRAGFTGRVIGELISETYETELETLSTWMAMPDTRAVIMDPAARLVGFAWFQEPSGKLWWTMLTGA
ncbi:MAG: serine protease [Rhodobacterales bacterium 17-64-5]|nr:MAG: serine protease [Rhodobacterales bacterium 12-65-15]OZA11060.1 MAG: serine protease [Rhodobacterales bacterium 17-64-5]